MRNAERDTHKIQLRFDKVATRVIERLRSSCNERVPDGMTVLLTITAPIRLPSQTIAALQQRIQTLVETRPSRREVTDTIHGNRVRIQLLGDQSRHAIKMIGFVHNPVSNAVALLNMTRDVLANVGVYQSICSQLRMPTG